VAHGVSRCKHATVLKTCQAQLVGLKLPEYGLPLIREQINFKGYHHV
jgi:hypothetical protein